MEKDFSLTVVIPFDKRCLNNTTKEVIETTQEITQETTQEKIIKLLKANSRLTRKDLATLTNLTEDGVKYNLAVLKKRGKIEHYGSTKNGYWEVL